MIDKNFHPYSGPKTLAEITAATHATVVNGADMQTTFQDLAPLGHATSTHIAFFDNKRYLDDFRVTKAGACFVHPDYADQAPNGTIALITSTPYRAYALAATLFYPEPLVKAGTHPTAVVDPSAMIGPGTYIGPYCVVEANAKIGANCWLQAHVYVDTHVEIGDRTRISSHTSISYAIIGQDVFIKPGARIGQKGFGFFMDTAGHLTVPQLGRVVIKDNVEIGANVTIDRGASHDTVIGNNCRIDNLVQLGHNVQMGDHCVIVAQVGIAGSTKLGNGVILGGQVGLAGHITIGDGVKVAAQSGVMRDVPAGATIAGSPAVPGQQWHRQNIMLAKLAQPKRTNDND